jgi:hypothetical protein
VDDLLNSVPTSVVAGTAVNHSMNNEADSGEESDGNLTPVGKEYGGAEVSSVSAKSTSSSKRRITASEPAKNTRKKGNKGMITPVDQMLSSYLGDDDHDDEAGDQYGNITSFKQLRIREVKARECEAQARMLEAKANSGKAEREESELLSIQAKANLLCERKKLFEKGISQEEIDKLLPLRK